MKDYKTLLVLLFCAIILTGEIYSQDTIYLSNPSFEDTPRHSHAPKGWINCGFQGESAPDTQPDFAFKVTNKAYNGNTYLGMVVRDNNTWELVGTELGSPLKKDSCYRFEIKLAKSPSYISFSRKFDTPANYITPVKLRIWGSTRGLCDLDEFFAETEVVTKTEWEKYSFYIHPQKEDIYFIVLEAFYDNSGYPYNGNLLLDDASPFILLPSSSDNTHLHEVSTEVLTSQRNTSSKSPPVVYNVAKIKTEAASEETKSHACLFLDQLTEGNIDEALRDLARYSHRISEDPSPWTILVSGQNKQKMLQLLKYRIRRIGLKPYFKVADFKKAKGKVELVCRQSIDGSIVGVYY